MSRKLCINSVTFLPRMHNVNLILRKHQTNPHGRAFYKPTCSRQRHSHETPGKAGERRGLETKEHSDHGVQCVIPDWVLALLCLYGINCQNMLNWGRGPSVVTLPRDCPDFDSHPGSHGGTSLHSVAPSETITEATYSQMLQEKMIFGAELGTFM